MTVPFGPGGSPIEHFLIDPPIPIEDLAALGIGPRGVHLIERNGVYHIADVIGQESYPNVWDFVAESRMCGISRRAELPDYSKITSASRLLVIHQRAIITNFVEIANEMGEEERRFFTCVRPLPPHHKIHKLDQMCCGLWRHDVEEMEGVEAINDAPDARLRGERKLKCWAHYAGFASQAIQSQHQYGFFGSFPLGAIEIIEDPEDKTHMEAIERTRSCSALPVSLVKE